MEQKGLSLGIQAPQECRKSPRGSLRQGQLEGIPLSWGILGQMIPSTSFLQLELGLSPPCIFNFPRRHKLGTAVIPIA